MSEPNHVTQDTQSPVAGRRSKTFEHRLVDVANTPPSGETYDAIGREADETIAAYNRRCVRLDAKIAALRAELQRKDAALKACDAFVSPKSSWARGAAELSEQIRAALQPKDKPCPTA